MSQLLVPGALRKFLEVDANVPSAGKVKALGSNHLPTVRSPKPRNGLPTTCGRWRAVLPIPAWSRPRVGSNGRPDWKVRIPESCHPPKACPAKLCWPLRNGISHTKLEIRLCSASMLERPHSRDAFC